MKSYIYLFLLMTAIGGTACKKNEISSLKDPSSSFANSSFSNSFANSPDTMYSQLPGVTFYQNVSYGGTASPVLLGGAYDGYNLNKAGVPLDWASSAKIPFGVRVTMYDSTDYKGQAWVLYGDTPNFSSLTPTANDKVSSIKIDYYATLYQNTNYGGTASQPLYYGSYTTAQLAALGVPNDWAHSIRVPRGLIVMLFADDNFQGKCSTFTADDATMSYAPYNDIAGQVSSCKILYAPWNIPANPVAKSGYTLTFDDEFNGSALDTTKWSPYYFRGRGTDAETKAHYTVGGGFLNLQILDTTRSNSGIQTVEGTGMHFTGGRTIPRNIKFEQTYGYFEARIKTQYGTGSCSSFWMIGAQDGGSIQSAESDIIEQPGSYGDYGYPTHYTDHTLGTGGTTVAAVYNSTIPNLTNTYNIYAMEWTSTVINYYFNNRLYFTTPNRTTYNMGVVLSTYNASDGFFGTIDPTVPYPKTMSIDYVRAYRAN